MKGERDMATTKRDVDRTYCRMVQAAQDAGLNVEGWFYQSGSTTNGIAWALGQKVGTGNDIVGLPSFGHIGRTAREAEHFLAGMVAAFESIAYAERRKG